LLNDPRKSFILSYQNYCDNSYFAMQKLDLVIGIELEFYLLDIKFLPIKDSEIVKNFITEINLIIANKIDFYVKYKNLEEDDNYKFSLIKELKQEKGLGQIEIVTFASNNIIALIDELYFLCKIIKIIANSQDFNITFKGQPFIDDCGSSLQFNLSFRYSLDIDVDNVQDRNIFIDNRLADNNFAKIIMQKTIINLLNYSNQSLIIMAPEENDYLRYDIEVNKKLYLLGKYNSPTRLCFGVDNRTAVIRLINNQESRNRIEYRIASANCNIYSACSALLLILAISGDDKKKKEGDNLLVNCNNINNFIIYGNAFLEQYQYLEDIISNIATAKIAFFKNDNIFYNFYKKNQLII